MNTDAKPNAEARLAAAGESARIVSVNISAAKGGRKQPAGKVLLRVGHGIEGDGHAGDWHRQVSLLAWESIEKMKRKGLAVGPGDFAENVTTCGVTLEILPVGTRMKLGPALVEITQIGKRCHARCEIFRQAGDCVMPREGIFAVVIEGGEVAAGDALSVEAGDFAPHEDPGPAFAAAVVTVSDKGSREERPDESGAILEQLLDDLGAAPVTRLIVPDERRVIAATLERLCDKEGVNLILTTGGTGLGPRDVTPEATAAVITRPATGFAEAIRAASQKLTPLAMLSRGVSGIRGGTLIINLPGSPRACRESFAVIAPALGHALEVLAGSAGDCGR